MSVIYMWKEPVHVHSFNSTHLILVIYVAIILPPLQIIIIL